MPHLSIEYSANLEDKVEISELCNVLRQTASEIETFPTAGIRVRAFATSHFSMADGDPKHGFVDISVRVRRGRPHEVKADATRRLFDAATLFMAPYMAKYSIALSLEMRDIDPDLAPKTGNIREHMG